MGRITDNLFINSINWKNFAQVGLRIKLGRITLDSESSLLLENDCKIEVSCKKEIS